MKTHQSILSTVGLYCIICDLGHRQTIVTDRKIQIVLLNVQVVLLSSQGEVKLYFCGDFVKGMRSNQHQEIPWLRKKSEIWSEHLKSFSYFLRKDKYSTFSTDNICINIHHEYTELMP